MMHVQVKPLLTFSVSLFVMCHKKPSLSLMQARTIHLTLPVLYLVLLVQIWPIKLIDLTL